jgi:hypothetical protein
LLNYKIKNEMLLKTLGINRLCFFVVLNSNIGNVTQETFSSMIIIVSGKIEIISQKRRISI